MRLRAILMLVLALVIAAGAVYATRAWISSQIAAQKASQPEPQQVVQKGPELTEIVVARSPLTFGNELSAEKVKILEWPANAVPPGAFKSTEELLGEERRVVLQPIEPNEPVLASKISGPGGRASLSTLISEGMRAVTIRVNDVLGVAGFVMPNDRVDIMLTRQVGGRPVTDVLLQNVRVLGIDQSANQKRDRPKVAKAVTLEVTTEQAQKLTLASQVGTLSLTLRDVENVRVAEVQRVNVSDLEVGEAIVSADIGKTENVAKQAVDVEREDGAEPRPEPATQVSGRTAAAPSPLRDDRAIVGITRGLKRTEVRVNPETEPPPPPPSQAPPLPPQADDEPIELLRERADVERRAIDGDVPSDLLDRILPERGDQKAEGAE